MKATDKQIERLGRVLMYLDTGQIAFDTDPYTPDSKWAYDAQSYADYIVNGVVINWSANDRQD